MRKQLAVLALVAIFAVSLDRPRSSAKADDVGAVVSDWTHLTKVAWRPSLPAAQTEAKEKKKLVFAYHLVGKMDAEGC
jgi:hypothetical protein